MGANRAYCCHFPLSCSTSLLGELNKTGQFCLLFKFSGFYPHLQQRFWFFIYFHCGFQSSPPPKQYPLHCCINKKKKGEKLQIGSLSLSFWKLYCAGLQNLNLGPVLFRGVFASEESSSFSPFQSPWGHTNAQGERAPPPPPTLAKFRFVTRKEEVFLWKSSSRWL